MSLFGPEARPTSSVKLPTERTSVRRATRKSSRAIEGGVAEQRRSPEWRGHDHGYRCCADTATAHVVVTGIEKSFAWSFRNHVESVFAKTGCNSGACHGALAGKTASSSRYSATISGDFTTLTRQARGRRMCPPIPAQPAVTKPTGAVPHKGGLRFSPDSLEYRVLAEWIAAGMPEPTADDPRVDRIEILPPRRRAAPGDKQQFLVRPFHRWTSRRRHAMGKIHFGQRIGGPDRRPPDRSRIGHGEGRIDGLVRQPRSRHCRQRPYEKPSRRMPSPRPRAAISLTNWCWRSWRA